MLVIEASLSHNDLVLRDGLLPAEIVEADGVVPLLVISWMCEKYTESPDY